MTVLTAARRIDQEDPTRMQARDIAVNVPTITVSDSVAKAVQVLALGRLPGLIVVEEGGTPLTVLPGSQVMRLAIPAAYLAEPALARTIDEDYADTFWRDLRGVSVGECLPLRIAKPVTVRADANLLEVAALMANAHMPIVAVVDESGHLLGAITLAALLTSLAVAGIDE
jgi:CBS domain-containing protein